MAFAEQELTRVHERLDKVISEVTEIKVAVARIEERLPDQPCEALTTHLESHKENKARAWQIALKVINPAAIWAALAWMIARAVAEGK
jgi:hypothetical protein